MWCPRCGNELPEGHRFCNRCGGPLEVGPPAAGTLAVDTPLADRPGADEWRCHECGRLNAAEHRSCRSCGSKMPGRSVAPQPVPTVASRPAPYVAPNGPNHSPGPPPVATWVLVTCGLVIIAVVAVLVTKPACEKERLDVVLGAFAFALLGDDTVEERLESTRCPLGFKISFDLVDGPTCPVHGTIDEDDVEEYYLDELQPATFPW